MEPFQFICKEETNDLQKFDKQTSILLFNIEYPVYFGSNRYSTRHTYNLLFLTYKVSNGRTDLHLQTYCVLTNEDIEMFLLFQPFRCFVLVP